jgi:hypothetical protein
MEHPITNDPTANPLITFTADTIPVAKAGISLQAQAAYVTAVADINGQDTTPATTPIIGAVPVAQAKAALEATLGIGMANPHAVIMRYGDHSTSAAATTINSEDIISTTASVPTPDETPDVDADDEEPEMSINGLLNTIKDTPSIPLAIVGDAGTGKTSIIRQWAEDNGYELNLFLANTASEDDVAGAITPDHEKKMAIAYPLEKLHRSTTHKTVLFLDELNTARREVQDPLLTLIQDRCLPNGTPLHKETIIVTAINPSATYNNHEMSPQLRNRFMWYYHNPSEYDWLQWMSSTPLGTTPAGKHLEAMVLDGTLKFDKDDAFTGERNEFTTPRSLYNLLKVSKGSVTRLKAFAETLVAAPTAEGIRLHGYTDKDSRGNSFFEERAKEPAMKDEKEVLKDFLAQVGSTGIYNLNNGLDMATVRQMWEQAKEKGTYRDAKGNIYRDYKVDMGMATPRPPMVNLGTNESAYSALGGSVAAFDDVKAESNLMADIQARMSKFGA